MIWRSVDARRQYHTVMTVLLHQSLASLHPEIACGDVSPRQNWTGLLCLG